MLFGAGFTDSFSYHLIADDVAFFVHITDNIAVIAHNAGIINIADNIAFFI